MQKTDLQCSLQATKFSSSSPLLIGWEAGTRSAIAAEERLRRYLHVLQELEEEQAQDVKIGEVQHVSELSNWLKQTGYHAYLDGLDDKEFSSACGLPDRGDEPVPTLAG